MAKKSPSQERHPVDARPSQKQPSMLHSLPRSYQYTPLRKPYKAVAVLVCHGMGQQVPFATLEQLADRLSDHPTHKVRHIHFEDSVNPKRDIWLPRAEIEVAPPNRPQATRCPVHVYEAYWAPLAEGHITLPDVIRFMASAGVGGLRLAFSPFLRWLFGKDRKFKIPQSTPLGLLGALLLVIALVLINLILTLVAGENLFGFNILRTSSPALVDQLTIDLGFLLLTGLVAGGTLLVSARARKNQALRPWANAAAWIFLLIACCALVGVAGLMGWHYFQLRGPAVAGQPVASAPLGGLPEALRTGLVALVWVVALGASWWLRGFFVQYMGDVALYVDAYKVDKYHKLRTQIREQAYRTVCALYGAREEAAPGAASPANLPFLYDRIILVGHSLGSVIAYDALNAMLKLDETLHQQLAVKDRTRAFITFGSPLDKTAFIFHA